MIAPVLAALLGLLTVPNVGADSSLIVSTEWLAQNLGKPDVVLLHVHHNHDAFRDGHIAGARFLSYHAFTMDVGDANTELPPADSLRRVFESLGISDSTHVVLTGPPLMATRAFWTLDYLGLTRLSILEGGVKKWRAEGRPMSREEASPAVPGHITARTRPHVVATAEDVRGAIGRAGIALMDTRTPGEYDGSGDRRGLPSEGHIEGARLIQWQQMFEDPDEFTPKALPELRRLWAERVAPGDTVITYCLLGYRASGTYFMSRFLGYPVRMYDGSYDDWSDRRLPVVKEPTPLRRP